MNTDNFAENHRTLHWVSVEWGTPSKKVTKVLMRRANGLVEEGAYNRKTRTWVRDDGLTVTDIVQWSLLPDSIPQRPTT